MIYLGPTVFWDDVTEWKHGDAAQLFTLPQWAGILVQFAAVVAPGAWFWQGKHIVPHYLLTRDQAANLRNLGHPSLRLVSGEGVLHAASLWRRHRSTTTLKKIPRNRK